MLIGLVMACNKNENFIDLSSQNIVQRSDSEQGYTDTELNLLLNTAAVSLFDYARNPAFVQSVFEKARDTCSGDFEVLFRYINEKIDTNFKHNFINILNANKMKVTFSPDVERIVGNYPRQISTDIQIRNKIFEGDDKEGKYFAQVFIPFLERFSSNDMPKAIVVNSLDGTANEEFFGYEISKSGQLTTKMISEDYAKNNLVWVISMNENIRSNSSYLSYILCKDTIKDIDPPLGDTLVPREGKCKRYFVDEIYLKEDLEDWVSGNSDVYCITAFMLANGVEKCPSTHVKLKDVPGSDLNKWISLGDHEVTHVDDRLVCPNEVLDFIIYEQDVNKVSWQREFHPWKGVGTEWGNATYYYSSKQNKFFSRTFPLCGRLYNELPSFYHPTLDNVWDYNAYAGKSKTTAAVVLN